MAPILVGVDQSWCKCMARWIFNDFPDNHALFGLVIGIHFFSNPPRPYFLEPSFSILFLKKPSRAPLIFGHLLPDLVFPTLRPVCGTLPQWRLLFQPCSPFFRPYTYFFQPSTSFFQPGSIRYLCFPTLHRCFGPPFKPFFFNPTPVFFEPSICSFQPPFCFFSAPGDLFSNPLTLLFPPIIH